MANSYLHFNRYPVIQWRTIYESKCIFCLFHCMWSHVECTKVFERLSSTLSARALQTETNCDSPKWKVAHAEMWWFLASPYSRASLFYYLFAIRSTQLYFFPLLLWHDTMRYNAVHIVCVHLLFFISLHWHRTVDSCFHARDSCAWIRWHWIRTNGANIQMLFAPFHFHINFASMQFFPNCFFFENLQFEKLT